MMRRWLIACLTLLPLAASAGFIQLQVAMNVDHAATPPVLSVTARNKGDNPARSVTLTASLDAWCTSTPPVSAIAPGDSFTFTLPVTPAPSLPGSHAAVATLRYCDDNHVPFSAVTADETFFPDSTGAARRPRETMPPPDSPETWVVALLSAQSHSGHATLSLRMMALTDTSTPVRLRVVLPDELRTVDTERLVTLLPDTEASETFEIDTRHAHPGGTYAAWIILDNTSQGRHRTATSSTAVQVEITRTDPPPWHYALWLAAFTFIIFWCGSRCPQRRSWLGLSCSPSDRNTHLFDTAILLGLTAFLFWHLSPANILLDTTTVGGDTPAHNYMASHLREQLLHHGRIISWANGWWCGFPLFQYYFPLPYLLIAGLSLAIPFNIAFKLVSILGILTLPSSAFAAARILRLPRPTPILFAILMVPFLFVREHTMWGVNIASTLAGMIANSLSFALMLPAVASVWRDTMEGRLRLRSVFLFTLVMASHFFTSVMTILTLAIAPLIALIVHDTAAARRRAILVLLAEGALAALLMAWWIVPLVAKSDFSMDFGTNWTMTLWKNFPPWAAGLAPLAVVAIFRKQAPSCYNAIPPLPQGERVCPDMPPSSGTSRHSVWLFAWMLAAALFLFQFGYRLSPVFVNCRLWPFLMFALTALGAIGLGLLLQPVRRQSAAIAIVAILILIAVSWSERQPGGWRGVSLMRTWAEWNFSGLERKPSAKVFEKLVLPLRGTPGRLANDLHDDNNRLGSSRIFELAPHLAGKPILEGGLVNSALGSMFAYYIQSETSDSCAGAPPIVKPSSFNFDIATRHLERFNVKHFIARSPTTQQALNTDPRWRFLQREEEWELFELTTHNGSHVFIPKFLPAVLETTDPNQRGLDWIYVPGALDQPFILANPRTPPLPAALPRVSETEFQAFLHAASSNTTGRIAAWQIPTPVPEDNPISHESVTDDAIRFRTRAIFRPHILKINFFPNWQARGASGVYRVTPAFLLVFPVQEKVELFYGSTTSDRLGLWMTVAGWLLVGMIGWRLLGCKAIRL